MMQPERRLKRRKAPQQPTYINLESNYPGKVQDISESGLRFRVIDPLEPSWQIHFCVVANSKRIRGTGELVWTGAGRKTGGLRFTHLSAETREQIRTWLDESSPYPGTNKSSTQNVVLHATTFASPKSAYTRVAARACDTAVPSPQPQAPVCALTRQRSRPPKPQRDLSEPTPLPSVGTFFQEIFRPPTKSIFAAVLVMSLAVSSVFYGREVGEWLTGRRATVSSPSTVQKSSLEFDQRAPMTLTSTGTPPSKSNPMKSASPQSQAIQAPFRKPLASSKGVFVQVAAVPSEEDARAWLEALTLREKGMTVVVRHSTIDGFYLVLVGPYPDEKAAETTQRELRMAGYEPFIRH
jgi:cell division septation protein DedD